METSIDMSDSQIFVAYEFPVGTECLADSRSFLLAELVRYRELREVGAIFLEALLDRSSVLLGSQRSLVQHQLSAPSHLRNGAHRAELPAV